MYWLFLFYEINVFLKENSLIFVLIFIGENFLDLDFFGYLYDVIFRIRFKIGNIFYFDVIISIMELIVSYFI